MQLLLFFKNCYQNNFSTQNTNYTIILHLLLLNSKYFWAKSFQLHLQSWILFWVIFWIAFYRKPSITNVWIHLPNSTTIVLKQNVIHYYLKIKFNIKILFLSNLCRLFLRDYRDTRYTFHWFWILTYLRSNVQHKEIIMTVWKFRQ